VPDEKWGENVCAVIVPTAGATVDPDAVVATARAELAGYKSPRHVVQFDALPKNATGKVVKAEIRSRLLADPTVLGIRR
jgi:acyl-CoA synthetase (AMP-forming)/AMP-acid ligase II